MKYQLKTPKYFVGQEVEFLHHNGKRKVGRVVSVETHYSCKIEDSQLKYGYHIYAINTPTSKKRSVWIAERYVLSLI